jgi:hypothetical protein
VAPGTAFQPQGPGLAAAFRPVVRRLEHRNRTAPEVLILGPVDSPIVPAKQNDRTNRPPPPTGSRATMKVAVKRAAASSIGHATPTRARDRAPRRPDEATNHRSPRDPRPSALDDRDRARSQPTGDHPPAPPPLRRRPHPVGAVARRPAGPPLQHRATSARTDHGLVGGDRRRTPDLAYDRRGRWVPPWLTS